MTARHKTFLITIGINKNPIAREFNDSRHASGGAHLELVAITENGELIRPVPSISPLAPEVVKATTQLYRTVGYELPWIGYLAV